MFAIIVTVAATSAVIAHLITVVRSDRPVTPPRSHRHEIDRATMRLV